ncbi:hypothetical protein WJX79_001399 [Trebouxia sp. C0005]
MSLQQSQSNETTVMTIHPWWTVHQLKKLIQLQQSIEQVMGVPLHNQRLIFAGHQLESAFTLHDYGLKKGYMLYLSVRVTDR